MEGDKVEIFCWKTPEKASSEHIYSLLKTAVKRVYGIDSPGVFKTESGKPYFKNSNIHFSLSHSGNYALCVLDSFPIGADIQIIRSISPSLPYAVCTLEELEEMDFFTLWTVKESYIKLYGKKSMDYKDMTFSKKDGKILCFDEKIFCSTFDILPGYALSVCAMSEVPSCPITFID